MKVIRIRTLDPEDIKKLGIETKGRFLFNLGETGARKVQTAGKFELVFDKKKNTCESVKLRKESGEKKNTERKN